MPLEIRELIIKATVTRNETGETATGTSSNTNNNVSSQEEIITACVEQILEILKEKNAR